MRFVSGGPDIPIELIRAQERGECVFVCGAGVSRTVGLPSFVKLTKRIYAYLHEDWALHLAEREAIESDPPLLDRALFALHLRRSGTDKRRGAELRRRIVAAVQQELPIPRRRLSAHHDILRLSRDAEMRPRVVTTNFDTLFERAWHRAARERLPSFAVADMPPPGSADFSGVLHLHGRIDDPGLKLARSDLVLNSADFGEAYLRSGWAARYVYDLARTGAIVIVGYGADDPPVRYMLDVLTADRSRYSDLNDIYAFVESATDAASREAVAARWQARGVTPILYDCDNPADHSALYTALGQWADYADDPTAWQRTTASALLARRPDDLADHDWDQLAWTLQRGDGARILAEANPEAEWAAPLQARDLIGAGHMSVGRWIDKRLADRHMVAAALRCLSFDEEAIWWLSRALEDSRDLPSSFHQAWTLILEALERRRRRAGREWYVLIRQVRRGQCDISVQRGIAQSLRPRLAVAPPLRWPGMPERTGERLEDLVHLDFSGREAWHELLEHWPAGEELPLLRRLDFALAEAIEDAREYGFIDDWRDRTSDDVRSVSRHSQDRDGDGFYPIVRVMADLWGRLAASRRDDARSLALTWGRSAETLPKRLHLHALSVASAFSAGEAAESLIDADDVLFWGLNYKREVMRLLAERWPEFAKSHRSAIEARIARDMPLSLFREEVRGEPELAPIIAHETFQRLSRLSPIGPGLSRASLAVLASIAKAHPHWESSGERDDFSSWTESRSGAQGDPTLLANIPFERLVEEATAVAEQDPLNQGDIWRRFTSAEPERAFEGLRAGAAQGTMPGHHWIPYFWALNELDKHELQRRTLDYLASPDAPDLSPFSHAVINWIERKRETLRTLCGNDPSTLLSLWDRLATAVFDEPDDDDDEPRYDDPITAVLNRAEGQLARFLVDEQSDRRSDRGTGIASDLVERFNRIVGEPGAKGFVGRAALTWDLTFLSALDPEWSSAQLELLFDWAHPEAAGHWAAFARARTLPDPGQFARLKAGFLEAFRRSTDAETVKGLTGRLIEMIRRSQVPVADRYDLEPEAARQALRWSEEARRSASFYLYKRVEEASPEGGANLWRADIGPTFVDIWPMEPELRNETSTLYLSWMVQRCGTAFPEAVETVAPALLVTSRAAHGLVLHIDDEKGEILRQYPEDALKLFDALVDRDAPPDDLAEALETLAAANPTVRRHRTFRHLLGIARRRSS